MIACRCNGRLGNHLYEIATTISVAKAVGTDFVVPTTAYAGHRGTIPMELEGFSYPFRKEDVSLPNKYNEQTKNYKGFFKILNISILLGRS